MVLQYFKNLNNLIDLNRSINFKNIGIFSYLGKKERTNLLALDIGASCIKAVEIARRDGELFLEKYFIIPLPNGCIEGHQIKQRNNLIDILKKFVDENNYQEHDTSILIGGPQIVTQVIKISNQFADNQLLTHIELEAEKYLPFDVDDLSMDFDVLHSGEEEEGYIEILLAAAKKGYVNEFIDVLETVGLNLRVIDVYSCVMGRLSAHIVPNQLKKEVNNKVITMIDIGHEILTLSIFKNDRQIYIKEQAVGGKDLTQSIIQEHNVAYEQAEDLKLKYNDPMIAQLIEKFRDKLVKQVYHMLQFFYASAFADKIDYVFVIGGVARLPQLAEALSEKLSLPVELLNPFELINIEEYCKENNKVDIKDLENLTVELSSACGLGIRSYVE